MIESLSRYFQSTQERKVIEFSLFSWLIQNRISSVPPAPGTTSLPVQSYPESLSGKRRLRLADYRTAVASATINPESISRAPESESKCDINLPETSSERTSLCNVLLRFSRTFDHTSSKIHSSVSGAADVCGTRRTHHNAGKYVGLICTGHTSRTASANTHTHVKWAISIGWQEAPLSEAPMVSMSTSSWTAPTRTRPTQTASLIIGHDSLWENNSICWQHEDETQSLRVNPSTVRPGALYQGQDQNLTWKMTSSIWPLLIFSSSF